MRIAILALRHATHTVRWVNALAERGHDVHLIYASRHRDALRVASSVPVDPLHSGVRTHTLPIPPPLGYLLNTLHLRQVLRRIQPDVLNTHFVSGYGTLARLAGFRPNIVSVWGSDVYEFPDKSPLHRRLIRDNLRFADAVTSTSHTMAERTRSVGMLSDVTVVPFGIDTAIFTPGPASIDKRDTITIGTIKTLAPKYGIDLLIRAFAKAREALRPELPHVADRLRLLIVGGGPDYAELLSLTQSLGVADVTTFAGRVLHSDVPAQLQALDIYVALSRAESFGVAVLEASAVGVPVVVSRVGGLPEVVHDGHTGLIVPGDNAEAASGAIQRLILEPQLRHRLGGQGARFVRDHYDWWNNVSEMEAVYRRYKRQLHPK